MTSDAGKSSSWGEIVEEEEEEEGEEEEENRNGEEVFEIKGTTRMALIKEEYESSLFSFDINGDQDIVYVEIWRGNDEQSAVSMDALVWTLNHAVVPSSSANIVYLVHVFPELRHIPTPLGKLPISQANPEQKDSYIIQERSKRREYLQKFLDLCSASKVNVETVLIESDMEAKAILDLIPILNIRKLVLGINKSSLRKMKSKKGNGTADQILQSAPEFCEVKIICEGKEVSQEQLMIESPSPSPRANNVNSPKPMQVQDQINDSFTCSCFKPKFVP